MQRRRFVLDVFSAGAAAGMAMCVSACGGRAAPGATVAPEGGVVRVSLADHPGLGAPGGALGLEVSGMDDQVLVVHRPEGGYIAVNRSCTHLGCDVNYDAEADTIECPCHKSIFSAEPAQAGARMKGPAKKPLASYPVEQQDDALLITVG